MENPYIYLLSFIVFLPAAGALLLALFPRNASGAMKSFSLLITILTALPALYIALPGGRTGQFDMAADQMQNVFSVSWIPSFDIQYFMGIDGISFPLVALTAFICVLAMAASWSINKYVKAYCILFLLLETGMLGVFMALDFFLFYVFWEVMLLPMYFLIGVWGGPRKEYAAIKFFLYTLAGSVLMLIAILLLYFSSDVTRLSPQQLADSHVLDSYLEQVERVAPEDATRAQNLDEAAKILDDDITEDRRSKHTFNIMALAQIGQSKNGFTTFGSDGESVWLSDKFVQRWAFILLLIGFLIKVPAVPVHTWLPDAHVEAPTPISMILAGILLKMGGYGIIRICYPICPDAGYDLAWIVCGIGVVSMIYGGFAALAQKDFKRLVAYSSVSHMGYVVLGLGGWSAWAGTQYNPDYWNMGMKGAMFQMIAHGVSSAGMFFLVGVIYERVHHRNLNEFGGLFGKMPLYTGLSIVIFFAALGLPGLCGFWGEVFVVLSAWRFSMVLAVISASTVIITAAYILWTIQRVYLGHEYRGPHEEAITPINSREISIAVPLVVFALWFGVYPATVLQYMDPTIDRQAQQLADWTEDVKQPRLDAQREEQEDEPEVSLRAERGAADPTLTPAAAVAGRYSPSPESRASNPEPLTPSP